MATLLCWWRLCWWRARHGRSPAATTSDRPPGAPDGHRPWLQSRDVHLAHVGALDEQGHDAFGPVEHIGQLAGHVQAELGDAVEALRVAADHVQHLVLLVPALDPWILGGV